MNTAQVRPSRVWYWVGGALAFAGLTVAAVWIGLAIKGVVDRTDELQRVPLPGEGRVAFEKAGDFTLYVEAPGVSDDGANVPRGEVVMEPVGGGQPVEFSDYDADFSYDWGGHEGRAVSTFEITEPGIYRVRTATESGLPEGDVALGESLVGDLPRNIVFALVVAFLALVGAAVIITLTGVRRHRARKALAPSPGTAPPPPGSYQPYPGYQRYPPSQGPPPYQPPPASPPEAPPPPG